MNYTVGKSYFDKWRNVFWRKEDIMRYCIVDTFNNDEEVADFYVKDFNRKEAKMSYPRHVVCMDDTTMRFAAHIACYHMNLDSGYGVDEETRNLLASWNII